MPPDDAFAMPHFTPQQLVFVLLLAVIVKFNARANPLGFIYATMIILVVNSITHFYTVSHLTATTALSSRYRSMRSCARSTAVYTVKKANGINDRL